MKYKFMPDTLFYFKMDGISFEEYLELQNKYRVELEKILMEYVDFSEIDRKIKQEIDLPVLDDKEYNYYHKFSTLKSNYIYLRNNYHIENLSTEELQKLRSDFIDKKIINDTFSKVLFEEGDYTFFGIPVMDYSAPSKSMVFEFAYDQIQLKTIPELSIVDKIFEEISSSIQKNVESSFPVSVSFIRYNGIPDIYRMKNGEE